MQSVYRNFGINLPRTSGEQGACGSAVASLAEAQPGDLIWYSGHIGKMCIRDRVGTLFIVDFKLRKPSNAFLAVLVILVACAVIAIFLFSKYHISLCFPGLENSILDRLMR